MREHRWSGWPGAFCLDCGCEDPHEIALADKVDDPTAPLGWRYEFPNVQVTECPGSDIVKSLRAHRASAYMCQDCYGSTMDDAADEIERLAKAGDDVCSRLLDAVMMARSYGNHLDWADAAEKAIKLFRVTE